MFNTSNIKLKKVELYVSEAPVKPVVEKSTGEIEIESISADARSVTLESHLQKALNLENWKLVRKIDEGARVYEFKFPAGTLLLPDSKLKVTFFASNSSCIHFLY